MVLLWKHDKLLSPVLLLIMMQSVQFDVFPTCADSQVEMRLRVQAIAVAISTYIAGFSFVSSHNPGKCHLFKDSTLMLSYRPPTNGGGVTIVQTVIN